MSQITKRALYFTLQTDKQDKQFLKEAEDPESHQGSGITRRGFPKEWHSMEKWENEALVHYVSLARLRSSSVGVSLGPLRLLNNAGYSLSRELISSKLSNQHWRAWRALKERLRSEFVVIHKKETVKASFSV